MLPNHWALLENLPILRGHKISNIFLFGSRVYGTHNQFSDYDFIIVGDFSSTQDYLSNFGDLHLWPEDHFQAQIATGEISALECLFLPPEFLRNPLYGQALALDLNKLRESISAKASNSWVKAKKKLVVENEPYLAQKSLFHSLRILNFGIQLATHGKITDYQAANPYWEQIKVLPLDYDRWKQTFQPIYNGLKSDFKKVTP